MAARNALSQIDHLLASAKEIQLRQSRGSDGPLADLAAPDFESLARRRSAPSMAGPDWDFHVDTDALYDLTENYEIDDATTLQHELKNASPDKLIAAHIQSLASLRGDIETMIRKEGRRSFWNGLWTNAIFFVLGLVCAAVPLSSSDVLAFLRR